MTRAPLFRSRIFVLVLTVLLSGTFFHVGAEERNGITLYVATNGNDAWSGTLANPNQNDTDGPFASLERARQAARLNLAGGHRVTVCIRGGIYPLDVSLKLDSADSGTEQHPVVWRGYREETVRLTGARAIRGFHTVSDPAALSRLQQDFRDSVLVANLKDEGIADFGVLPNRMNLFFKGRRMQVARYPNTGWLTIASVPLDESHILNVGDKKVIKNGLPAGRHSGVFTYPGNRPSTWAPQDDIWMHGYWVWDWRDAYQKVARIDTGTHLIHPTEPHHYYGYQQGQRFCFLNVLEELDTPGEWALDEKQGLLYFWPPSPLTPGDASVSMLAEPMVLLSGASHVRFQHLTLEMSRARAIAIRGGANNVIEGCTIRNIDNDTCVIIDGGKWNGIRSCDIYDVGSTGIRITGGDRNTLAPAGNFATNNHIYRYGCIIQSFNGGVFLQGVGNIVSHNRIHDAPFSGIQYYGNDHIIECNELFDLAHESGDVGGINTGADYSEMGTIIRYNYIHDAHGYGEGGFRAIYLDLPGSNTTIFGNILANVDIGVFFNSGRDNVVQNNIFFNCHPSVNIYLWPHTSYFRPGGAWKIVEKLHAIRYNEPPYSTHYPMLPSYLDSTDLGKPYGHTVTNNISLGGTWLDLSEGMDFRHIGVENNVVHDSMLLVYTRKWFPAYDPYHIGYAAVYAQSDTAMVARLTQRGNSIADPLLVDPPGGDFRVTAGSPAWKSGFKTIPIETIGLCTDAFRTTLPEASPRFKKEAP
jgi:parallel beta-helix repeat protein